MREFQLKNNITTVFKVNKNTPRTAICVYLRINSPEKKSGLYTILNRLFLQGTKNRSAETLARELDEKGIDLYSEMKYDFIRFKLVALNEDLDFACEILSDIIQNSTLELFEKECFKLKGEIQAELDNAKNMLMEDYFKNLYEGHYYGNTYLKILEALDGITADDVKDAYDMLLNTSEKCITACGDFDENYMEDLLNKHFATLKFVKKSDYSSAVNPIEKAKISKLVKNDANQAQIVQGWIVPTITSEEHVPIMVFSTILGSMGLSSRLFRELREKKGLAYTVRSSYDTHKFAASLSVYIATEPSNIEVSIQGFKDEIQKIKDILIDDVELQNAKNNILGKRQFFTETNLQQASLIGYYVSNGFGANYSEIIDEKIKNVTAQEVQSVAQKYFNDNYVLSIIAPENDLNRI